MVKMGNKHIIYVTYSHVYNSEPFPGVERGKRHPGGKLRIEIPSHLPNGKGVGKEDLFCRCNRLHPTLVYNYLDFFDMEPPALEMDLKWLFKTHL
jgi:hypothetical protein